MTWWKRLFLVLLIVAGACALAVALMADLMGIGGQTGFGDRQLVLALVGAVFLSSGVVLIVPFLRRRVFRWIAQSTTGERPKPPIVSERPMTYLFLAMWFGLVTGLIEVATKVIRKLFLGHWRHFNPDLIWMTPLADVFILSILGIVLALVAWRWPKLVSLRTAAFILAFPSFLSLLFMHKLHILAKWLFAAGLAVQTARLIAAHPLGFHKLVYYTVGWARVFWGRKQNDLPQIDHTASREPVLPSHRPDVLAGGHCIVPMSLREDDASPSRDFLPSRRQFLLGTGATIAGLAAGVQGLDALAERCALAKLPRNRPDAPNVLLIVLDTVRAQSLSLHGYRRPTTPNLERLARSGVRFDWAIAPSPWTLPTHACMFTGRYHYEVSADWTTPLDETHPTLAEELSAHSYLAAGFVANYFYCGHETGLDRGFAHYEDYLVSPGQMALSSSLTRATISSDWLRNGLGYHELLNRKTVTKVNSTFLRWLSTSSQVARQKRQPFFAFLNYFDAHEPYLPPPPFDRLFGPPKARDGFLHSPYDVVRDKDVLSPQDVQAELDAYEGAIAHIDHSIGLLLDELAERGVLDNTVVIITSDHGEEFGEHGIFEHGGSLYLPSVYVPLLISFPSRVPAGIQVREPVSLCDLPATIMDLAGLDHECCFPGNSLARYWNGTQDSPNRQAHPVLSEVNVNGWDPAAKQEMKSVIVNQYHYIKNGDGSEELYDLGSDPWEKRDLVDLEQGRRVLDQLRASLEAILSR